MGQVIVGGSSARAVRIDVNPTQINHYGLSLEDLRTVISSETANLAKGSFADKSRTWLIHANDQLMHAADYEPLLIKTNNGAAIQLTDVAKVTDSVQTVRSLGIANGQRAALIIIFRQPGANIIGTVDGIRAALPQLHASHSSSIDLTITLDQTPDHPRFGQRHRADLGYFGTSGRDRGFPFFARGSLYADSERRPFRCR